MDQFRSLQHYITDPNLVAVLKQKAQDQIMASMNISFAFKALCFAVLFFYVGALYVKSNQPKTETVASRSNPHQAIEYANQGPSRDKVEEWKRNAWTDWMVQLDDDWKDFNAQIEEEKKAWIEEKEGDWVILLKHLQNKWLHFNPNLDAEYQTDMLAKSETWDERQWKMWISTEGKQLLEMDLKKWFTNNEMIYCKWTMDEWNEWKNEKIKEWVTSEWKESEDQYWSKYDDATIQTLTVAERNQWFKWKERIYREGIEWKNWIAIKESKFVNANWNSWSEWKNEKRLEFNDWIEAFVEKWIRQKQWLIWTDERKNFANRQKAAPGGVAAAPGGVAAAPGVFAPRPAFGAPSGFAPRPGFAAPSQPPRYSFAAASGYVAPSATSEAAPATSEAPASAEATTALSSETTTPVNPEETAASPEAATPVNPEETAASSETTTVNPEAPVAEPEKKEEEPAAEPLLAIEPAQTEPAALEAAPSTSA
ncbi:tryptophan-rich antigen [Plasmodium vivax]|uniref:Tryptophan-rich protein n=1 Tax=Plasmodium vivax TaxID=5855 RepID=A0A564ZQG4_PLAVI|nr:tryptophan-rich antigen [Plasmodium vivax]